MDPQRDETDAERMDRNWNELLQELRVTQTGIQVLAGFLITLPFQQRFTTLSDTQRGLYLVTLALALLAVALLLTPVLAHRALFRHGVKGQVVQVGHRMAQLGTAALGATLVGAAGLITWVMSGRGVGLVAGTVVAAVLVGLWLLLPAVLARQARRG